MSAIGRATPVTAVLPCAAAEAITTKEREERKGATVNFTIVVRWSVRLALLKSGLRFVIKWLRSEVRAKNECCVGKGGGLQKTGA